MKLALDIETIPSQCPDIRAEYQKHIDDSIFELSPPASYSKAKQDEWLDKKSKELLVPLDKYEPYRKLSFDGGFCQILSIGLFSDAGKVHFTDKDEKQVMTDAFKYITEQKSHAHEPVTLIGHNIIGFDLRVIRQRAMVLGVAIPPFIPLNAKPWDANPYDTMTQWDAKNFVSMDKLCKIFGITGKEGMDGSKVYDYYLEGRLEEIGNYCADDAEKAMQIYQRMTFTGV